MNTLILFEIKQIGRLSFNCLFLSLLITSCGKNWLEVKPQKSLVIPETLSDLQGILDNSIDMNGTQYGVTPSLGELSGDDFFLSYADWLSISEPERNCYIWAKDIHAGEPSVDWNSSYKQIYQANVILDAIEGISRTNLNEKEYDNIKGSALFFRAFGFFNLAQVFCPAYNVETATTDLGIPLRLHSEFQQPTTRSTVQQTYDQIIKDLANAASLLSGVPQIKTRPSVAAALGLLARVHMSMKEYDIAGEYADKCLSIYNYLIDYNTLDPSASYPLKRFNNEVIFHSNMRSKSALSSRHRIDTALFKSYAAGDLRKMIFFKTNPDGFSSFKGSYYGSSQLFSGIATDEIYLIRAEYRARRGDLSGALADLNTLLVKRWNKETFTPISAPDAKTALSIILLERRKELVFRGLRWIDLRRLNQEQDLAKILVRELNNEIYQLPANSNKYVLPIPADVLSANPEMQQNIRE